MYLTHFKALIFDCYGTIIDREGGLFEGLRPLIERLDQDLTRAEALEAYRRHESAQKRDTPTLEHHNLLPIVYKRIADEWRVPAPWAECVAFGLSTRKWPIFEDAPGALQYLKKFYKLIVLSDIDTESFLCLKARLPVEFDAVLTADNGGSSRPGARDLAHALEMLARSRLEKKDVIHVVGGPIQGGSAAIDFGIVTCSIRRIPARARFPTDPESDATDAVPHFDSLADFVGSHQNALRH